MRLHDVSFVCESRVLCSKQRRSNAFFEFLFLEIVLNHCSELLVFCIAIFFWLKLWV